MVDETGKSQECIERAHEAKRETRPLFIVDKAGWHKVSRAKPRPGYRESTNGGALSLFEP
jgi:hypothetical protein